MIWVIDTAGALSRKQQESTEQLILRDCVIQLSAKPKQVVGQKEMRMLIFSPYIRQLQNSLGRRFAWKCSCIHTLPLEKGVFFGFTSLCLSLLCPQHYGGCSYKHRTYLLWTMAASFETKKE